MARLIYKNGPETEPISDENKKAFIRILKELGIYPEWYKLRKQWEKDMPTCNKTLTNSFRDCLEKSFPWCTSKRPNMWLYMAAGFSYVHTPKDVLNDDGAMHKMKENVIYYSKNDPFNTF
jgi:hypothetical protein